MFRLLGTVLRPARLPSDRPAFTPTLITNADISAVASERNIEENITMPTFAMPGDRLKVTQSLRRNVSRNKIRNG